MNKNDKFKQFKTAGLILRPQSKPKKSFKQLNDILSSLGIKLLLEKRSAKLLNLHGMDMKDLCEQSDLLISLGGDGTLLYTARSTYPNKIPILGINAGNLGFLTLIKQDEMKWFFGEFKRSRFDIQSRLMLEIEFIKNKKCIKKDVAFNDVVFSRDAKQDMIKVDAYINSKLFNSYYGDGVIFSTPTGSTAYNLSSGGPIIYPLSNAFVLTSICPHSLTQRPLVMPSNFSLIFKSEDCKIVIDGQNDYFMSDYDEVLVKKAKKCTKLISHKSRDYFDILREKLNWGNL